MTAIDPTQDEKEKLQEFYQSTRKLLASGVVPPWAAQRGFDETLGGFLGDLTWRPTHISWDALEELISGNTRNVQRAHGIGGRLDRYDRTSRLLTGPEQQFDEWWSFYLEHDATVLITKSEHNSGKKFSLSALVALPPQPNGMFIRAGFSFKVRKKVEIAWLKSERLRCLEALHWSSNHPAVISALSTLELPPRCTTNVIVSPFAT